MAARTLIVSPTRGTHLSYGKTVTLISGTLLSSAYPLSNLTDGAGRTVCRLSTTNGQVMVDLGSGYVPDLIALVNTNIDNARTVSVVASNASNLSSPTLSTSFAATLDPVIWIDLRSLSFSASRYWAISVTGNSVPLALGEFVVATADEFDGILSGEPEVVSQAFRERSFTEYGVPYTMSSGAVQRAIRFGVACFADEYDTLKLIFDDAGGNGRRVLVVPDSTVAEAFFVDLATMFEATRENQWNVTASVEMLEESFGVLPRGLI